MRSEYTLIEAQAGGKAKVAGTAYGGGKLKLAGWKYPVVVDLAGMEIPGAVPLLANHENRTGARVGVVTAQISGGVLAITGEIVSESEEAKEIIAQAKAGADWQLSIGADIIECELFTRGSCEVNCQPCQAPFYHVRKSALREVSVVAVGADGSTQMRVAAKFCLNQYNQTGERDNMLDESINSQIDQTQKETAKPDTAQVQAAAEDRAGEAAQRAVKAERDRVSAIQKICGGEFPEIEREAVQAGWSPETVTGKVLAAVRAARPAASVYISSARKMEGGSLRKTIEAALCLRCGIPAENLLPAYGEPAVEAGAKEMDMPLKQLLIECMKLDGIPCGRGFDNETIRAAFTSVSLPGILSSVANKKLLQSYEAQPVIAAKLCSTGDLNDFKETERFRLTDVGELLPVAPDGEIKEGGIVEESAKNQLETYGKKFCLTRKMIINDDLGAFMKVPAAMGNRAARLIDQLFFSRLLANPKQADGKDLFSKDHRNFLDDAKSALSADSLARAVRLFLDQVDADGQPVNVEPRYLLVPTALKHLAIELTRGATLIMAGGAENTVRPALNVLADENLQVVSSPYLANSAYRGASESAWYLFGDPRTVDTFELGFLKGKRTPTVERGETDYNTLGIWFRVYFDIGVREQDFRGMVKAKGAN